MIHTAVAAVIKAVKSAASKAEYKRACQDGLRKFTFSNSIIPI